MTTPQLRQMFIRVNVPGGQPERIADRYPLSLNALAQQVFSSIPGWGELVDVGEKLASLSVKRQTVNRIRYVYDVKAGADPLEAAAEIVSAKHAAEIAFEAADLITDAQRAHNDDVADWIEENQAAACAGVEKLMLATVKSAKAALPALANVHDATDLPNHPDAIGPFKKLHDAGLELQKLREIHRLIVLFDPGMRGNVAVGELATVVRWPLVELIRTYTEAWPKFYRFERLGPVAVQPPWRTTYDRRTGMWSEITPAELIRTIAEKDWQLWAPTAEQIMRKQHEVDEAITTALANRTDTEINEDKTIELDYSNMLEQEEFIR